MCKNCAMKEWNVVKQLNGLLIDTNATFMGLMETPDNTILQKYASWIYCSSIP